ncbi:MAG: glycosyltransferase family 39 protein [Thermanaerothrix sp.]|uniref:glycosyltransferase family 39 protein n=1 Tax=Thermanaerothrix sp. TaxID=2972675 RepID=UPI003C7E53C7
MKEPTILDFVKALLTPWRGRPPAIPPLEESQSASPSPLERQVASIPKPESPGQIFPERRVGFRVPWSSLLAVGLALLAQRLLEPPRQGSPLVAVIIYAMAFVALVAAIGRREWQIPPLTNNEDSPPPMPLRVQTRAALLAAGLLPLAFIALGGNRFTVFNLVLWLGALAATLVAFILPGQRSHNRRDWLTFLHQPGWTITISRWAILLSLATLVVAFFRFYRLDSVLGEMFSDHAEKLLDVADVLQGQTSIFFPRNTGREAFQMYLTALIAVVAGTDLSFMSLKLGTALAGFIALPFIYLLGKEIGGKWTGLTAFLLAGMAYWPNVISRVGLRFPLYPMAAAPALYFLIRGLRHGSRNDFIWSGLALGVGLHGYSPTRLLPVVMVLALVLYLLHRHSEGRRWASLWAFGMLAFTALVVFLPLLRYMMEQPDMFAFRALTRLSAIERPYPAPVWQIFLSNLGEALVMFFYDNGNIWVHSIPGRPALDIFTAVLYFLGLVVVGGRYLRERHWVDLFLLLSIPMLMMPSILSLAFPEENPSLNRTGGAIVPVFIIAAIGLISFLQTMVNHLQPRLGRMAATLTGAALLIGVGYQNFDLVFRQFDRQFMAGAWNTSQIGHVIRAFADSIGNPDSAYVVPYPYWVDTRLVGINAGYPLKDYALWPQDFEKTLDQLGAKLFILKPEDQAALDKLRQLYPTGFLYYYDSHREGKDFLIFFVPPTAP